MASSQVIDINKDTIMKMLRTDVFGYRASDIEGTAKEVFHLVSNEGGSGDKNKWGYARNKNGFIVLKPIEEKTKRAKK